jgi:hypothetical protein
MCGELSGGRPDAGPHTVRIPAEILLPDRAAVLREQGVPEDARLTPEAEGALAAARTEALRLARPMGMYREITPHRFAWVLEGEGLNAPDDVVSRIYPRASRLALFAATLGPAISETIQHAFRLGDYPFAYNLDCVASSMADAAAAYLQQLYQNTVHSDGWGCMRYSPGYCGWHLTGQRRLFAVLDPSKIGMSLTESCLMQPLKSVSGVLIAGPRRIHVFSNNFPYCEDCLTKTCRDRIRALLREGLPEEES